MKAILTTFVFFFSCAFCIAQDRSSSAQPETFIDRYMKVYHQEPKYMVNTMGEAMIKRSNELGMWSHPSINRIMKQVKLHKYLSFNSSEAQSAAIIRQLDAAITKNSPYKEYYRWELNGITSGIIYTRTLRGKITELVNVSVGKKNFLVACYAGDDIDLESVRLLALGR